MVPYFHMLLVPFEEVYETESEGAVVEYGMIPYFHLLLVQPDDPTEAASGSVDPLPVDDEDIGSFEAAIFSDTQFAGLF